MYIIWIHLRFGNKYLNLFENCPYNYPNFYNNRNDGKINLICALLNYWLYIFVLKYSVTCEIAWRLFRGLDVRGWKLYQGDIPENSRSRVELVPCSQRTYLVTYLWKAPRMERYSSQDVKIFKFINI